MINKRFYFVLGWFLVAFGLHLTIKHSFFSLIPFSISMPFLLTWLFPKPAWYLLGWALIAELVSTVPFGIMTIATFLPLFVHYIFQRIKIDLSFSFLGITLLTIILQISTLVSYDVFVWHSFAQLPWTLLGITIGLTTFFEYSVCLIVEQLYPSHA